MMAGDDRRFWDEVWESATSESPHTGADAVLVKELTGVKSGDALDVGCGDGSNAIWLAEQGWRVTAVDFSRKAVQAGRRSADAASAEVEFIVADAAIFRPESHYDLITSFYIHLPPVQRAAMLSNICAALKPGGMLLFVSHDISTPPPGWSEDDMATLTSVEEVVAELNEIAPQKMEIERALVVKHAEPSVSHEHDHAKHAHGEGLNSTVVIARARENPTE